MGDNYCDAINNRAFCNYDGGDCCASTVKTKKVGLDVPLTATSCRRSSSLGQDLSSMPDSLLPGLCQHSPAPFFLL